MTPCRAVIVGLMDDGAFAYHPNAPLTPLPPHSGTGFSASVHECVRILEGQHALGRNEQAVMVVKIASLSKARMALMRQACYDGVISLGLGWDEVR